ncbi:nitroreductase family protein [Kluyveromyces lactis]|uniref:KLLA0C01562p n=1 Tax=Kluyveromyces lactis (strain ATCC 8585 / CBS 2359 / DSM 70799 / NBRC 1267 / NRRL Y-1140 / WM37) TaxID=284590 RepID=Q6CUX4_KLULA|nr:uncharacterized protein KLLA0_C01562g [Kluyveromyces lactis]CAH01116.1 KLLA0C01562p [Kluyveromyces lactis]|eukprot:XP_452265.1 uncharacterized protein KLLA0_C01562g [Kluyveromyces lactis]
MSAAATKQFLKAIAARRTIYALKPELPSGVSINDVQEVVQAIVKDTPTSFNCQGNRAIILTGETHKSVWDSVVNAIEGDNGKKRPASARDEAFGSIIFLTDDKTTEKLQADFPAWSAIFPSFAEHSSGAAQISTWTAIELLGLGGHLQHYNGYVKAALPEGAIPQEWTVQAQLVFGLPAAEAGEKTYIDNPVKILN